MDESLAHLLTLQAGELAIAVTIFTFFIRRVAETEWPSLKKAAPETAKAQTYTSRMAVWWNQVILYLIPVAIGVLLPLCIRELVPERLTSTGGIALWGMKIGWFSSFLYKVLKQLVKKKTGLDLPGGASLPPPPDTPEVASEPDPLEPSPPADSSKDS